MKDTKRTDGVNQSEAALEARRAYYREWRAKNRDRVKVYNARYWESRAQKRGQLAEVGENG